MQHDYQTIRNISRLAINEKNLGPSKLYKSTEETSEQQSQPVMVKLGSEG